MAVNIIDFQAHLAPERYLKKLAGRRDIPNVIRDGGTYIFKYGEDSYYPITRNSYDIQAKLDAMDKAGISTQVLSIIIPGAEILDIQTGNDIARLVNDEMAEVVSKYSNRFLALTTLPLRDTDASLKELERATSDLGFRGIMFFSNINGMPLSDQSLWPIYEAAQDLDLPIFIHPTRPVMVEEVKEYGLESIVGYMFDTSLAALKMVFSGVFERYPNLKVVLPHAGSTLPYLLGRIDYQSGIIPGSRKELSMAPSNYIKKLYSDTVCMSGKALHFAYDIFGPERLLFATDFPYCEMEPTVQLVRNMDIPDEHKVNIFHKNAEKLLKIK